MAAKNQQPHAKVLSAAPTLSQDKLSEELFSMAEKLNYGRQTKSRWFWLGKRVFDLGLAMTLLVTLSPLLILIAVLIKIEGRGPIFYRHPRIGERLKIFKVLKYRTMHEGVSPRPQPVYDESDQRLRRPTVDEDPRITSSGRILRQWSLDELPQLWNIIKGDMSFIGPRPLSISESIGVREDQVVRYSVPAGLSGLAQIHDRGCEIGPARFEHDIRYIENLSVKQESSIFFRTFGVLRDKY